MKIYIKIISCIFFIFVSSYLTAANFSNNTTLQFLPPNTVTVDNNTPITPLNIKESEINNQNKKFIAKLANGPDLTFNVAPPATAKTLPNGTLDYYTICRNDPTIFTPVPFSIYPLNSDPQYVYTIDWGDGSPIYTGAYIQGTPFTHNYINSVKGQFWIIKYTINYLGQDFKATYNLYVGSSPLLNLNTPNSIQLCIKENFNFPLNNVINSEDTKYKISFNDGTPIETYDTLPKSVIHSFKKTSCNVNSVIGGSPRPNSYSMTITAENKCGITPFSMAGIYISEGPTVDLGDNSIKKCVDNEITISGKVIQGTSPNQFSTKLGSCNHTGNSYWEITDLNGNILNSNTTIVELTNGIYGSNNGFTVDNYFLWSNSSPELKLIFHKPGVYKAKLIGGNACGYNTDEQYIYINPPILPKINTTDIINCNYLSLTLKNNTNVNDLNNQAAILQSQITDGSFASQNFSWNIYKDNIKIESYVQVYQNGTFNPSTFNKIFNSSGTYRAELIYIGNTCNLNFDSKTFLVPGDPDINIKDLNSCLENSSVTINSSANIFTPLGYPILNYKWEIIKNGNLVSDINGNPCQFSDIFNGGAYSIPDHQFILSTIGNYKIKLTIETSCGIFTKIKDFVVAPKPIVNPIANQVYCNALITTPISVTGLNATNGYRWENINNSIGLSKGDTILPLDLLQAIPSFTTKNTTTLPIIDTIKVFPLNDGCQGDPIEFTITINPSINSAPNQNNHYCNGDSISDLYVEYNGIRNNPNATYQWYSYLDGIAPRPIQGGNTATLTPKNTIGSTHYFCEISPKGFGCKPFNSQNDTITIYPAVKINDYTLTVKSGVNTNLTPINGINGVVPDSTQYSWTILSKDPVISGENEQFTPVDSIKQKLSLPNNYLNAYAEIKYLVSAIKDTIIGTNGERCQKQYVLTVIVVPDIKAQFQCNQILCHGGKGSIVVTSIVGITGLLGTKVDLYKNGILIDPRIITTNNTSFLNLDIGSYKLIISDNAFNFITPFEYECSINQPDSIVISGTTTSIKCKGSNDATISVNVIGGTLNNNSDYKEHIWYYRNSLTNIYQAFTNFIDWRNINNLKPGYYKLGIKDANDCVNSMEFEITEPIESLDFDTKLSNALECDNTNDIGGIIELKNPRGGTVTNINQYQFMYTHNTTSSSYLQLSDFNNLMSNISEGDYTITIKDINNCTFSKTVTINRYPKLTAEISSVINYDCANEIILREYTVTANGGVGTYVIKWFDGINLLATGNTYTPPIELNGRVISVEVIDGRNNLPGNNLCVSTFKLTPIKADIPIFDWTYSKKQGCNEYEFTAIISSVVGSNYSLEWDFGNGQETTKNLSITRNLDNYPNLTNNFKVELKILYNGCLYRVGAPKIITKSIIPILNITSVGGSVVSNLENTTIWFCDGDTIDVVVTGADNYSWSNGSLDNNIKINNEGNFNVWGKNAIGCESSMKFDTKFYKYNYSIVTDKQDISLGGTVNFSTNPVVPFTQKYIWDFGDNTPLNSTNKIPYPHTYNFFTQDYFDIILKVINPQGCTEMAQTRINVSFDTIPNTILPNSIFEENRIFLKGFQIQIFNRNGVLIYEGSNGWDGTHNGKLVSNDTYFYVMFYLQANGSRQTKKGFVTVIR